MPDPDCTLVIPTRTSPIVLHLHTRPLAAKSLFLRGIFSGASPLDLFPCIPRSSLPRMLQPAPHPILFLPVPDPPSIQLLIHWMYSGSTALFEHALRHGHVQWQGIARNVEYLGLPTDIKIFLGRWYRDWFLPSLPSLSDEASDTDESDVDSEDHTDDDWESNDDGDRGRSRDVKPVVQSCARLCLRT